MRYWFTITAMLFLLCGAALAGSERVPPEGGAGAAAAGASSGQAPDFSLPDLDGRQVTLGPFLGKTPVLLVFWATWCPECMAAIPEINALAVGPLAGKVQIFGLDYRESREKVAQAVKSRGIRYPVLLDDQRDRRPHGSRDHDEHFPRLDGVLLPLAGSREEQAEIVDPAPRQRSRQGSLRQSQRAAGSICQ